MNMSVTSWAIGIGVSVFVGWAFTWAFLEGLRKWVGYKKKDYGYPPVPSWLTGMVERLFFTVVVALELPGSAIAMIGWLTLKMATNWNKIWTGNDPNEIRGRLPRCLPASSRCYSR